MPSLMFFIDTNQHFEMDSNQRSDDHDSVQMSGMQL